MHSSFAHGRETLFQVDESERLSQTTYDIRPPRCDLLLPGSISQDENAVTFMQLSAIPFRTCGTSCS